MPRQWIPELGIDIEVEEIGMPPWYTGEQALLAPVPGTPAAQIPGFSYEVVYGEGAPARQYFAEQAVEVAEIAARQAVPSTALVAGPAWFGWHGTANRPGVELEGLRIMTDPSTGMWWTVDPATGDRYVDREYTNVSLQGNLPNVIPGTGPQRGQIATPETLGVPGEVPEVPGYTGYIPGRVMTSYNPWVDRLVPDRSWDRPYVSERSIPGFTFNVPQPSFGVAGGQPITPSVALTGAQAELMALLGEGSYGFATADATAPVTAGRSGVGPLSSVGRYIVDELQTIPVIPGVIKQAVRPDMVLRNLPMPLELAGGPRRVSRQPVSGPTPAEVVPGVPEGGPYAALPASVLYGGGIIPGPLGKRSRSRESIHEGVPEMGEPGMIPAMFGGRFLGGLLQQMLKSIASGSGQVIGKELGGRATETVVNIMNPSHQVVAPTPTTVPGTPDAGIAGGEAMPRVTRRAVQAEFGRRLSNAEFARVYGYYPNTGRSRRRFGGRRTGFRRPVARVGYGRRYPRRFY